ncbi:uncharacterized protein APUU_71240S [Aspergillus puulaauensis]|uniref:Uncharacterized protein n=1 Tax=Aspergillus puulaauensis TaxID=1220207 RepID=A0A7R7XXT5_9EURO|nr:uncharacterized protein APUU_71240S [Aspergillus puulaauensis]BCS29670.1 hypothetical protein APUU_71240S [Aspergillus puulaauensis]
MADRYTFRPLSDQGSPESPWAADASRSSRKIIVWDTPTDSSCMVVLVNEQVKQLFRQVLGRPNSSAARSILANFPTIPEPSWAACLQEVLPVQYLLVALKELTVVAPHHLDVRQAVQEAGMLVKDEALKFIQAMPREETYSNPMATIMAMDCFLALGLHVPTFYLVAKGFLLDFLDDSGGAMLLLRGFDGGMYSAQFSFLMFKNVLNYYRHNKPGALNP